MVRRLGKKEQAGREDIWDLQKEWVLQRTRDEGGWRTKDGCRRILVKGEPGKYAAIVYGTVQLCFDHEGEPKYGEYDTVPVHEVRPTEVL